MERCGRIDAYSFRHGWALYWKIWTSPTQSTGNTWGGAGWSWHLNVQCRLVRHKVKWGQCNHMHSLESTGHTTTLPIMSCAGEQWRHLWYVYIQTCICVYISMYQNMQRSVYALVWVEIHVCECWNEKNWIWCVEQRVWVTVFGKPQILCALLYWPWHCPKKNGASRGFFVVLSTTNLKMIWKQATNKQM